MTQNRRPGRPASFDRHGALDRAVPLFRQHGYDGASIAMLAQAMGVTAPTLYAAFGSKETLYCEALIHYQQQEAQGNAKAQAAGHTLYGMLESFLRASAVHFAAGDGPKGCMVAIGALQHGPDSQAAADATARARALTLDRFIAALDDAKARGEIAVGADSTAIARFYTAIVQGMAVQAIDGADARTLNTLVDLALGSWPQLTQAVSRRD